MRVCLGVSGSVAAVKTGELCEALVERGYEVEVVMTRAARHFWEKVTYNDAIGAEKWGEQLKEKGVKISFDEDEWGEYHTVGADGVLHIDIIKRCDVLVIAPLCANTLAKLVTGSCPDLLSSVARAWPYDLTEEFLAQSPGFSQKPFLVAPSMNTVMWSQKVTHESLRALLQRGVRIVSPQAKKLACGDVGNGAMADVDQIAEAVALVSAPGESTFSPGL
ncbi:Phosphopantothenoylcysteine decarboxylase [Diplonema papillatum]|nr:Phosphopantothenoylcysteine decarboxylase [Diplonema papillatum]